MILFINTTDLEKIHFALIPDTGKVIQYKTKVAYNEHHKTLELLGTFLKSHKIILHKQSVINNLQSAIKKIIVCSGPGSFTGTRVGVTIAQALGFSLNIPLHTIKTDKIPKNLKDLLKYKGNKKLNVYYNRPAIN